MVSAVSLLTVDDEVCFYVCDIHGNEKTRSFYKFEDNVQSNSESPAHDQNDELHCLGIVAKEFPPNNK